VCSDGVGAPLIGRSTELTTLRRALDEARSGQGRVVTVLGEAGESCSQRQPKSAKVSQS